VGASSHQRAGTSFGASTDLGSLPRMEIFFCCAKVVPEGAAMGESARCVDLWCGSRSNGNFGPSCCCVVPGPWCVSRTVRSFQHFHFFVHRFNSVSDVVVHRSVVQPTAMGCSVSGITSHNGLALWDTDWASTELGTIRNRGEHSNFGMHGQPSRSSLLSRR